MKWQSKLWLNDQRLLLNANLENSLQFQVVVYWKRGVLILKILSDREGNSRKL